MPPPLTQVQGPLLQVEHLVAGYGDHVVVQDVSFTVMPGETVALVGSSGCGKSTILRCLVGLLEPMAGMVRLFGTELWSLSVTDRAPLLLQVGLVFQQGGLLGSLTVRDNLALPLELHRNLSDAVVDRIVAARLAQVGLSEAAWLKPSELSGGMRKRVAVARAVITDPKLLLADEPTSGLDPVVAAGIDEVLAGVRDAQQTSMLMVSHDMASVHRLADHILMMADGTLVAQGSYDDLSRSPDPKVQDFLARRPSPEGQAGSNLTHLFDGGPPQNIPGIPNQ
ncbi:MAG: ATP-binding cassette domain-containing protein [Deltaproteobacteria bacterium]|nr:ATP-binding cassette domain-containing protein [Deltaproteobacteria bacterium]